MLISVGCLGLLASGSLHLLVNLVLLVTSMTVGLVLELSSLAVMGGSITWFCVLA
jgi:hypothetical protein